MNARVPPVVAVTGYKNVGKTTAIERLLQELVTRGYRVGTLKHCHCAFDVDRPGKDSWRHRRAGSMGTAVIGPEGFALVRDGEPDPREAAAWLFPDADLVLAEGFHWYALPRIEVHDAAGASRDSHPRGRVVASLPFRFGEDEVDVVAALLEEEIALGCVPVGLRA